MYGWGSFVSPLCGFSLSLFCNYVWGSSEAQWRDPLTVCKKVP